MRPAVLFLLLPCALGCSGNTPTNPRVIGADSGSDTPSPQPLDQDGDGSPVGEDCDDQDAHNRPGVEEQCDGADNDCDGQPLSDEGDANADGILDCASCAAAGYWPEAAQAFGEEAIHALFARSLGGVACADYSDARAFLFGTLDNHAGQVECLYTGDLYPYDPQNPDWDTVNTEHVWPRSQGAEVEPVECDLHHLFPADALVNTLRGALPFGEVASADWIDPGGSRQGTDASGLEVFEPRDARKGDIARAILYIAARYPEIVDQDAQRAPAQIALFQAWHTADPADEAELIRDQTVADVQGNRNPFIACPDLANHL